jgi:beta-N-acetylhexosaminidase
VKDDRNSLPLSPQPDEDVLLINFQDAGGPANGDTAGHTFREEFANRHARTFFAEVTPATSSGEAEMVRQLAQSYRIVVVTCSIRVVAYRGDISLTDVQLDLLRSLATHDGPFVFALFGSPYLLNAMPELPSYALAFESYPGAEAAMVRAILGEIPFQGRLPTTVGTFPVGFSLLK